MKFYITSTKSQLTEDVLLIQYRKYSSSSLFNTSQSNFDLYFFTVTYALINFITFLIMQIGKLHFLVTTQI